ncbi:MAG: hypothetical protein QOH28_1500 [Actinomycetota bacterium]|jgi:hypothetical protein|nr:hypothetical protein [Actinomycetota bacterium]
MSRPARVEAVWSIDDLELELRKLPGVRSAGFDEFDDVLLVQLHVVDRQEKIDHPDRSDQPVPVSASRIAARHSDRPVTVEIVRWRNAPPVEPPLLAPAASETVETAETAETNKAADADEVAPTRPAALEGSGEPARARLLAVLAFPDTDELEVHLVFDGRRTIGRAPVSSGIEGAVAATVDAVRDLGTGINARIVWVRALEDVGDGNQSVVAVAFDGVDARSPVRYGLSAGTSLIDAAARATLDALNRRLSRAV